METFAHTNHPVGALLPRFTFITGPNGSGKTTLGSQLFREVNGLQLFSFAEPLRNAIVGMFYGGDITIDLTNELTKSMPLPGFLAHTHRDALNAIGDWSRSYFGDDFIGQFARHRCMLDAEYFDRFVFDDARRIADVEPILHDCGVKDALLISLTRPEASLVKQSFQYDDLEAEFKLLGIRVAEIHNDGSIADLLPKLKAALEA